MESTKPINLGKLQSVIACSTKLNQTAKHILQNWPQMTNNQVTILIPQLKACWMVVALLQFVIC